MKRGVISFLAVVALLSLGLLAGASAFELKSPDILRSLKTPSLRLPFPLAMAGDAIVVDEDRHAYFRATRDRGWRNDQPKGLCGKARKRFRDKCKQS
jgi:hypothetical protein